MLHLLGVWLAGRECMYVCMYVMGTEGDEDGWLIDHFPYLPQGYHPLQPGGDPPGKPGPRHGPPQPGGRRALGHRPGQGTVYTRSGFCGARIHSCALVCVSGGGALIPPSACLYPLVSGQKRTRHQHTNTLTHFLNHNTTGAGRGARAAHAPLHHDPQRARPGVGRLGRAARRGQVQGERGVLVRLCGHPVRSNGCWGSWIGCCDGGWAGRSDQDR